MSDVGLKGNVNDLKKLGTRLSKFRTTVAANVASKSSPVLTSYTSGAFTSGRTVYGDARPRGTAGQPLSLEHTGLTKASIRFTSIGTIVRCVLGPRYAKYLIGKYRILPMGPMPRKWAKALQDLVSQEEW